MAHDKPLLSKLLFYNKLKKYFRCGAAPEASGYPEFSKGKKVYFIGEGL
jgi:hypothetical protein